MYVYLFKLFFLANKELLREDGVRLEALLRNESLTPRMVLDEMGVIPDLDSFDFGDESDGNLPV